MNTTHETQTVDVDALRAEFEALAQKLIKAQEILHSFVHTDLYGTEVARLALVAADAIVAVRCALEDHEVSFINEVLHG